MFSVAIKSALKQENLNPEIEEKLLQLQRYQEKQMKGSDNSVSTHQTHHTPITTTPRAPARKRPLSSNIPSTTTSNLQNISNNMEAEKDESPKKKLMQRPDHRDMAK